MARKRVVSRTIKATKATVLCINCETAEPFNDSVLLSGVFENDKAMLKAAQKLIETDDVKVVKVVDSSVLLKQYKMAEEKFMELADEIVDADEAAANTEE